MYVYLCMTMCQFNHVNWCVHETDIHTYAYMNTCMHTYIHTVSYSTNVMLFFLLQIGMMHNVCVYIHTHSYIRTYMYACMHIGMSMYVSYACICTYIYTYIYIYVYIYIYILYRLAVFLCTTVILFMPLTDQYMMQKA